jgi:hypothetical protein
VNSRPNADLAILAAATALTRFLFRSHYLYDVDSVNFALALERFDPSVHQPHPPGYFLYVYLGRLVNLFFHDANTSLVALSIAFSCGAAVLIYVLARNWHGRDAAIFAGLIFVFSPLAWFHGTVALTYIVEAFFSALAGYLCWRIYRGAARFILPGAFVVGIGAGFRPSSLLLLGPLLLFSLRGANRRQAVAGLGLLVLTLLAWFIPLLYISGGANYFASLTWLWLAVPSKATVFNSSVVNSFARAGTIVFIYFLFFGCASLLPVLLSRHNSAADRRQAIFTAVWIAPGLLVFTFIFLKFVNSGYLLALAPPVCAWMGLWASNWYARPRPRKALKILAIGACAAVNTMIFLWAPVYCSYGAVRRFESELRDIVNALPQIASQRNTLIIGFDSHFLGFRHAGYYLPGYVTLQFPEVHLASGTVVFAMQDRNTRLDSKLSSSGIRNFILFPLPLGDGESSNFTVMVRKRFPPGALRIIVRAGHEFALGPVSDLRFLFPVSAPRAVAPVDVRQLHAASE